jgi:hypothetical protein
MDRQKWKGRNGKAEMERQKWNGNWTGRTRKQNKRGRKEQTELDRRTRLAEQGCQDRAARIRQPGEDSQNRTIRRGHAEKDRQNKTATKGLP